MSALDEGQAIKQVVDHLAERFPSLSRERIHHVVDEEHHRLENGTVRDFVPVLVAHAAMDRLRKEAEPVRIAVVEGEAPAARILDDPRELDPMERERREREQHGGFLLGDLGCGPSWGEDDGRRQFIRCELTSRMRGLRLAA